MSIGRSPSRFALAGLAFLVTSSLGPPAQAVQTLTPAAISRGFTLTPYASNMENLGGIGPIGVAYRTDGKVLVSVHTSSKIYLLPSHADGQAGPYPVAADHGPNPNNAMAMAMIQNGAQWKYYLGQSSLGRIIEIDNNGAFVQAIVSVPLSGMVAYPPTGTVGSMTGHLFATEDNKIWNVDVVAKTKTLFASSAAIGDGGDGLVFSPSGTTLYVAYLRANVVRAYDVSTGLQTWQSPVVTEPDGIAIGLGTLTGYIYVNCNNGQVWELGVPGGPHPGAVNQIATGGTRGDFIAADPNSYCAGGYPSLLLTQSDGLNRLDPPGGGFFGPPTSSPIHVPGTRATLLALLGVLLVTAAAWKVAGRTRATGSLA